MRDPYEVLAMPRSATADDIKRSFRQRAKKLHPDANNNDPKAAALFAELNAAYAILGDRRRRNAFDQGEIDAAGKLTRQAPSHAKRPRRYTSGLWHIAICLVIAVLMPIATLPLIIRSLTPQPQINNANADGKSRDGQRVGTAQTNQASHSAQSAPHLVFKQIAPHAVGDTIPLGAKVSGGGVGLALEISGLPKGMTISSGRPQGEGRWRILATDVDNAVIHPPSGFNGPIDLIYELRLADDAIVERGYLHWDWLEKPTVPAASTGSADKLLAATDNSTNPQAMQIPASTDQSAIRHAAVSQPDRELIELMIGQGHKRVSEGEVGAAQAHPRRTAEAVEARATLALNATYDPIMLAILRSQGVVVDDALGRDWYKKFRESGSQAGQERAKVLGSTSAKPKRRVARSPIYLQTTPLDPDGAFIAGTRVGADSEPRIRTQLAGDSVSN
jgi:hypothetical protein